MNFRLRHGFLESIKSSLTVSLRTSYLSMIVDAIKKILLKHGQGLTDVGARRILEIEKTQTTISLVTRNSKQSMPQRKKIGMYERSLELGILSCETRIPRCEL